MKITSITVHKEVKENSRMRGKASVVLDDCFAIHDIRIIEGNDGLCIAMPSRQKTRKMFEDEIIKAYNEAE